MNSQEKYKYSFALTSVAFAGLSFAEDALVDMMSDATDLTRLRSFYILMSYNFELILKSRIVMVENFTDKQRLNKRLIGLGHDIKAITDALGDTNLQELGIVKVEENALCENAPYKVSTTDGKEVLIENFTKIRYDFLDDIIRSVDSQEHTRIKEYLETLFSILEKAKEKNEGAKSI